MYNRPVCAEALLLGHFESTSAQVQVNRDVSLLPTVTAHKGTQRGCFSLNMDVKL